MKLFSDRCYKKKDKQGGLRWKKIQVCCPRNMYTVILIVYFAIVIVKNKKCKKICDKPELINII